MGAAMPPNARSGRSAAPTTDQAGFENVLGAAIGTQPHVRRQSSSLLRNAEALRNDDLAPISERLLGADVAYRIQRGWPIPADSCRRLIRIASERRRLLLQIVGRYCP